MAAWAASSRRVEDDSQRSHAARRSGDHRRKPSGQVAIRRQRIAVGLHVRAGQPTRRASTLTLPLPLLASAAPADFAAPIAGWRVEKITELLLCALPKQVRKAFVPVPEHAARAAVEMQKDAFQRKVQTELDEMQGRITQLRGQVKHASAEARADIQKAIRELEKKKDLAEKKAQEIHSATASSWEQVKSKTSAAMDDLRESLKRAKSHLP